MNNKFIQVHTQERIQILEPGDRVTFSYPAEITFSNDGAPVTETSVVEFVLENIGGVLTPIGPISMSKTIHMQASEDTRKKIESHWE